MRQSTASEYRQVLATIGWPQPRYISGKRYSDVHHSYLGTDAATQFTILSRGKPVSVTYMINPKFLEE